MGYSDGRVIFFVLVARRRVERVWGNVSTAGDTQNITKVRESGPKLGSINLVSLESRKGIC